LQNARDQLLAIFKRQFELASQARDANATTRFFKLFPSIGCESEGLEAYAAFVVDLVRVRAPANAKSRLVGICWEHMLTSRYSFLAIVLYHDTHGFIRKRGDDCGPTPAYSRKVLREGQND
jgi:hypothetical protein